MTRSSMRLAFASALMLLAQLAHAQYAWIDDKGTRVFSDRPPPPGTPAGRILKAPHRGDTLDNAPAAAPAGGDKPKPPDLADREADYKKRQAEQQANAAAAQVDAQAKAMKQDACNMVKTRLAELSSGARIKQVDAKGEVGYMSDADRARSIAKGRELAAQCN